MKMKILYVTTIGITMIFFKSFIAQLLEQGHTVDIATNEKDTKVSDCYHEWGCKIYQIDCSRSPLQKGNLDAIKQIRRIVEETHYDIVHCHTPIAAACTRLACRAARKKGTRVFYTAHGFHFYKGASLQNWAIFYPIEKLCSYFTDVLITINTEDYTLAKRRMKAKQIAFVPGVGIDLQKFGAAKMSPTDMGKKRKELGVPEDAVLLFSVGELNENKNHETVIRAMASLVNTREKEIYYIIAGEGNLKEHLENIIREVGLFECVQLLGYRTDIAELCQTADIFVFPSYREGLSVSVMEAMASGLPVVCSRIRGNVDLIDEIDVHGEGGGVLFNPYSIKDCEKALHEVLNFEIRKMGTHNKIKIKNFEVKVINHQILELYMENVRCES